jgi:hypothetical protein
MPAPAPAPPPAAAPAPTPIRVGAIELGKAVGADERVTQPATTFATTDTIYASVDTTGSSTGVALSARWTYEDGQIVNESSETIAPTGPVSTEFHIAKPDGWPTGRYKVEISVAGAPSGSREFEVR